MTTFMRGYAMDLGPNCCEPAGPSIDPYMEEIFTGVPDYQLEGMVDVRGMRGYGRTPFGGPAVVYGDTTPSVVNDSAGEKSTLGRDILAGVAVAVALKVIDNLFFSKKRSSR